LDCGRVEKEIESRHSKGGSRKAHNLKIAGGGGQFNRNGN